MSDYTKRLEELVILYEAYRAEVVKLPPTGQEYTLRDFFAWLQFKHLPALKKAEEEEGEEGAVATDGTTA